MATKNLLKLIVKEITDQYVQENFIRLNNYFQQTRNLVGFDHFVLTVTKEGLNQKIPHNLGYVPKDVLVTSVLGPGILQFNYALFDARYLDVSILAGTPTKTDPVIIRAYIGTHIEGTL